MGRLGESIAILEEQKSYEAIFKPKIEEYKKKYKEDYGLPYGEETTKKFEIFIAWMRKNGAKFDKIRMRYYGPDYRGVHAYQTISEQETFLWVPKKLIITSQMGRDSKIGTLVKKSGIKISWDYLAYITIFLLIQQHDPNSFWKPYMDVYPKMVDNFPMFYSEEEKALLTGSPILEHIPKEIEEIREEYNTIVAAVPEFSQFTCEDYMKNKTLVISRIFYVKIAGASERIMVPLAG